MDVVTRLVVDMRRRCSTLLLHVFPFCFGEPDYEFSWVLFGLINCVICLGQNVSGVMLFNELVV